MPIVGEHTDKSAVRTPYGRSDLQGSAGRDYALANRGLCGVDNVERLTTLHVVQFAGLRQALVPACPVQQPSSDTTLKVSHVLACRRGGNGKLVCCGNESIPLDDLAKLNNVSLSFPVRKR